MNCSCGELMRVSDTVRSALAMRRRRICDACGRRIFTLELAEDLVGRNIRKRLKTMQRTAKTWKKEVGGGGEEGT
jgi:transcriptional regulator NrdR family protein